MRHTELLAAAVAELDDLYAAGGEVSFHALRQIPRLENVLKETLRLHPPLVVLMRVAKVQSYRNDHSKMVVQLAQPARVRYRRRH